MVILVHYLLLSCFLQYHNAVDCSLHMVSFLSLFSLYEFRNVNIYSPSLRNPSIRILQGIILGCFRAVFQAIPCSFLLQKFSLFFLSNIFKFCFFEILEDKVSCLGVYKRTQRKCKVQIK